MATPTPAPQGLSPEELMQMVEAERARRETGKLPVPPAVREPAFTGTFEEEREKIEQEALQKQIEGVDIFTPAGAKVAEERMEGIREVTRVPRTPTGEPAGLDTAVDPITALAGGVVEYLGLEPIVEAMKPQTIMSAAETEQAERQFEEDIARYYNEYLNKIEAQELSLPPQFQTYDQFLNAAMSQQGRELFESEFKKAGGPTGAALIRPVEEAGVALGQQAGMAAKELFTTEEEGVIKENIIAAGLRDLLIAETGVTALGQELISQFDDRIVEDKPVITRWAENQRRAEGVEQLTADTVETTLNAAGVSEEDRQGIVDAAWWAGLAGSMALPLDMYVTDVAKLGVKGAGAAVSKVAPKLTAVTMKGADPVANFLATATLANAAKLDPSDIRMQYAGSLSKTNVPQDIGRRVLDGEGLTKEQADFVFPEKLRDGREADIGFGVFSGRGMTTPKFVSEAGRVQGIVEGARRAVRRYALGTKASFVDEVDKYVKTKMEMLSEAPPGEVDNILKIRPENLSDELAGMSSVQREAGDNIVRQTLIDELALDVSTNAIRLRFEEGLAQLPADYVMVTSNFALPKQQVKPLYNAARKETFFQAAAQNNLPVQARLFMESPDVPTTTKGVVTRLDNEGSYTLAKSIMHNAMLQVVAERLFGANVITSSDLLKMSQKAVERADIPTIRRLEAMFTPDEVKTSGVAKLVRDSTDFFAKPTNPVIDRLNNELNARLANLDDEVVTKVEQKHDVGQPYIVSLGRYLKEDLGLLSNDFTVKFLLANLGVVDDVGTAFSSAGGARGATIMSGQGPVGEVLKAVVDVSFTEPKSFLSKLQVLRRMPLTEPKFWVGLEQLTTEIAGRKLKDVLTQTDLEQLNENVLRTLTDKEPKFTFDPTKQGENISALTLTIAREGAIKDFSLKLQGLFPEVFVTKQSLRANIDFSKTRVYNAAVAYPSSTYAKNIEQLYAGRVQATTLDIGPDEFLDPTASAELGKTVSKDVYTFITGLTGIISSPAEAKVFAINIMENVLKDRFLVQLGTSPRFLQQYFTELLDRPVLIPGLRTTEQGYFAGAVAAADFRKGDIRGDVIAELAAGYFLYSGVGDGIYRSLMAKKPFGQLSASSVGNYYGAYEVVIDELLEAAKKLSTDRPDVVATARRLFKEEIGKDALSAKERKARKAVREAQEQALARQVRAFPGAEPPRLPSPIEDIVEGEGVPFAMREELPEGGMTAEQAIEITTRRKTQPNVGPKLKEVLDEVNNSVKTGALTPESGVEVSEKIVELARSIADKKAKVMSPLQYSTRVAMDADFSARLTKASRDVSSLLAASPIEAALAIPFDIVGGEVKVGKVVKKEVTENYKTLLEFQRVNELFEAPEFTREYVELAENVKKNLQTAKENLKNQPDAVGNRATALMSQAKGFLTYGWDAAGALSRNAVLGGVIVPNIPHHVMNIMSAPSIMLSTIGLGATLKTFGNPINLVISAMVGQSLFANRMVPLGIGAKFIPPPTAKAFVSRSGKAYTFGELADIVLKSGISATVTTTEFRTQALQELVTWTAQNFKDAPTRQKARLVLEEVLGKGTGLRPFAGTTGPSVWQDFANASDMFFRTAVLIRVLKEGRPVEDAVRLARESLFDYGSIPKPMKDTLSRGFWLWSFRFLNDSKFVGNLLNNPNRLRQGYKLKKAGYDYTNEENETYFPFMAKYGDDRMWLGIYEDPEARRRYALMGPQVPMIDAAEDIFGLTQGFVSATTGLAQFIAQDPAGAAKLREQVIKPGVAAGLGVVNPVVEYVFINQGLGMEIAFGRLQDPTGYITPDLLHYYSLNGRFEEFVALYDIQRVEPRPGKPTWGGYEYRVNPKNRKAKAAMARLENWSIITGQRTLEGMVADINALTDPEYVDPRTEGLGVLGQLADRLGIFKGLDVPTKREMEEEALRTMRRELE